MTLSDKILGSNSMVRVIDVREAVKELKENFRFMHCLEGSDVNQKIDEIFGSKLI